MEEQLAIWRLRPFGINSVRRLLDAGCGLERMDYQGLTALHYAALYGYYDLIEILFDRGADASVKNWERANRSRDEDMQM